MLILIRTNILVMVLDMIHTEFFHCLMLMAVDSRKKKAILILGKGLTDVAEKTTLNLENKYFRSVLQRNIKNCLSFHYNGANSSVFVNGAEFHKFKAKDLEINEAPFCL